MKFENKKLTFKRSRKGVPCIWESLKDFNTMSRYSVLYSPEIERKYPILVKSTEGFGERLVPIAVGDFLVKFFIDINGVGFTIFKIATIDSYSNESELVPIARNDAKYAEFIFSDDISSLIEVSVLNSLLEKIRKMEEKLKKQKTCKN